MNDLLYTGVTGLHILWSDTVPVKTRGYQTSAGIEWKSYTDARTPKRAASKPNKYASPGGPVTYSERLS